jgi:hypothetical protein
MQVGGPRQVPAEPLGKSSGTHITEDREDPIVGLGGCSEKEISPPLLDHVGVQTSLFRPVHSYIIPTFGQEKYASRVPLRFLMSLAGSVRAGHGFANVVFSQITPDFRVVV